MAEGEKDSSDFRKTVWAGPEGGRLADNTPAAAGTFFRKADAGMAVLIAVSVIAILIAVALEVNRRVLDNVMTTAATRDQLTLSYLTSSAVDIAIAMLVKDRMTDPERGLDTIQEDWANPEKIAEALQDFRFDEGNINFVITDELGRIQVNSLVDFPRGQNFNVEQQILWDRFLWALKSEREELEEFEPIELISSLKDWLDSGDDDAITGLSGAESDYYMDLDPPYACKNGPMTHINELGLVRGMPAEFLADQEGAPNLTDFMTIHGMEKAEKKVENRQFAFPGKININTADLAVLTAIVPSENPAYAQTIFDYRKEKEEDRFVNDISNPNWYMEGPDIPDDVREAIGKRKELLATSSDFFRIDTVAGLRGTVMTATVIVHREKNKSGQWTCRVLSWETK